MSDSDSNQEPEGKDSVYASCAVQGHANLTYYYRQTAPGQPALTALLQPTWLSVTHFITERMRKHFAACRTSINSLSLQQLYLYLGSGPVAKDTRDGEDKRVIRNYDFVTEAFRRTTFLTGIEQLGFGCSSTKCKWRCRCVYRSTLLYVL